MNPISAASMGLFTAGRRFDQSAQRLSAMGSDPTVEPEVEIVEMIQSKAQFKASAAAVRMADEMLGVLLDIKA